MPPLISSEDYVLIQPYIVLPFIISALERDRKVIAESGVIRTPYPYILAIDDAIKQARTDLYEIKQECRKRGIKVFDTERNKYGIAARYMCRGYHGVFEMLDDYLTAQASVLMHGYIGGRGAEVLADMKRPPD